MNIGKFYRYLKGKKYWSEVMAPMEDGLPRKVLDSKTNGVIFAGEIESHHLYFGEWQEMVPGDAKPEVGEYYIASLKSDKVLILREGDTPGRYARALVHSKFMHWLPSIPLGYPKIFQDVYGPLRVCEWSNQVAVDPVEVEGHWYNRTNLEQVSRVSAVDNVRYLKTNMRELPGGVWVSKTQYEALPRCSCCGDRGVTIDLEFGDCPRCASDRVGRRIRGYHQQPPHGLVFHKTKDEVLFIGAEIEADPKGGNSTIVNNAVKLLMKTDPREQKFYLNRDGSLNGGFELITMPHSMEKFMEEKEYWTDMLKGLTKEGMRAHDTNTCGQHFHVSKAALKPGAEEAMVAMFEANYPDMLHFSRRTQNELQTWASRYASAKGEAPAKKGDYGLSQNGRRCAVNRSNTNTVEFRFFKGTLNPTTFYANLQLVWSMCLMANKAAFRDRADDVKFQEIVDFSGFSEIKEYWELRKTQKRERLVEDC